MGKQYHELVIVGGGAAGLFAAAMAVDKGIDVCILEKNPFCGKKIGITGKGRCNITNTKPWEEFSTHIHPSANFFKAAFRAMSNEDTIRYLNSIGLPTVVERGCRVYPESMCAKDVSMTLAAHIRNNGGTILTSCNVYECNSIKYSSCTEGLSCEADNKAAFTITYEQAGRTCLMQGRYLLLATGGLSYPATGSTGDGYAFAQAFGHSVTHRFPSLTALVPEGYASTFKMSSNAIEVKNVEAGLEVNGSEVQREFGDLTFTDGGIEGPIGFKISRKAVESLINGQKLKVHLDLKPAVSLEALESRIERELGQTQDRMLLNQLLRKLLPGQLIEAFCKSNGLNSNALICVKNSYGTGTPKQVKSYKGKIEALQSHNNEIIKLASLLKNWQFKIVDHVGYNRAVVTAGGVSIKEISQKTMESKLVPGLYIAGELLNLDADTGGYNLQIAFSTASLAVNHIATKIFV